MERKDKTTKWTNSNETEGPMRGASQIENPVKKSKTLLHKVNISMCIMSGSKRTILQVTKCTSNVVLKRLVRVCFKKFLKTPILQKLLSGTDLQIKFHNFNIPNKIEA